ncbi:MAG: heme-copper oxidase subunit III [Nitrososphaerota archaeon]
MTQESAEEEHEGSPWPAIVGLGTAPLIAGLILILKGVSFTIGLGLVGVYLIILVAFVGREIRHWPHVIASFFSRLRRTPIPAEPELVSGVGVPTAIFLFTEVALFGAGFASFFAIRATFATWPPPGAPHLEDFIPKLQTLMLLLSSLAIEWAIYSVKRDRRGGLVGGVLATALLGTGFLVLKLGFEWPHLWEIGFTPASGIYGANFYLLLGAHGAHVLGGVVALSVVASRAKLGQLTSKSHGLLESVSIYWHFVHLVWLLLFAIIYEGAFLWG